MNYEETIELENNIQVKNKAKDLYNKFLRNVKLDVGKYKDGRFCVWSDSHNAEYLKINGSDRFVFQCRFLHESYDLIVHPSYIFNAIKNKHRVIDHFESFVNKSYEKNRS